MLECRGHVRGVAEALEHGVHVAGIAQVDQTDHSTLVLIWWEGAGQRNDIPLPSLS